MTEKPKPDLTEHEDEAIPFDEVMQKLVKAKPALKKVEPPRNEANRPPKH